MLQPSSTHPLPSVTSGARRRQWLLQQTVLRQSPRKHTEDKKTKDHFLKHFQSHRLPWLTGFLYIPALSDSKHSYNSDYFQKTLKQAISAPPEQSRFSLGCKATQTAGLAYRGDSRQEGAYPTQPQIQLHWKGLLKANSDQVAQGFVHLGLEILQRQILQAPAPCSNA